MLDQSDDDWPKVPQNFRKARQVWNNLGKLIRREGSDPQVSEIFYGAVVQAALLVGGNVQEDGGSACGIPNKGDGA